MEFCTTFDMIGDYFTKAIQGYQSSHFCNIVIGIHEDSISYYNMSGRAFLEEKNIKLDKEKEEVQKADKLTGD